MTAPTILTSYQPPRVRLNPSATGGPVRLETQLLCARGYWFDPRDDVHGLLALTADASFATLVHPILTMYDLGDHQHFSQALIPKVQPGPNSEPHGTSTIVRIGSWDGDPFDTRPALPQTARVSDHIPLAKRFWFQFDLGDRWTFLCRRIPHTGPTPSSQWAVLAYPGLEFAQYGYEFAPDSDQPEQQIARPRTALPR